MAFLPFVLVVSGAAGLLQLGALAATVKMLWLAVFALASLVVLLAGYLIVLRWRR